MPDLQSVQQDIEPIEGWLRPAQARRLWELAAVVPRGGSIVEIGSYQGKSTIVLASAAGDGVRVHAIDPHAGNDRGPGEWEGAPEDGQADHEAFRRNLEASGISDRVEHVREFSQRAQGLVAGPVDFLYVDGAHGYGPALSDIEDWGGRVVPGGTMAIHDVYTSVFVTLAVVRSLWLSADWRYLGRVRSLAVYERVPVHGRERLVNLGLQAANVGWFAKNVLVKAAAAMRMKRLAKLGHAPGGGIY